MAGARALSGGLATDGEVDHLYGIDGGNNAVPDDLYTEYHFPGGTRTRLDVIHVDPTDIEHPI